MSLLLRFIVSFSLCSFLLLPSLALAVESKSRVVRVAFFPMYGFHHYSKDGKPIGYDVDYLDRIAALARWDVHYVPTATWGDALKAVQAGEVDLMGATLMDPQRMRTFEYSAQAGGKTEEVLLSHAESQLVYEDFENFNGLRIGCVNTSLRREHFEQYATKNSFRPNMVYFDSVGEMRKAIYAGEIDAMVAAMLEILPGDRILGEFSPAPFYYVGTKGNTALMNELDTAMSRIHLTDPEIEDRLLARWYPQTHVYPFNRKELDYIEANRTIKIHTFISRAPFSLYDPVTKTFTGIVPDILNLIGHESGLSFELLPLPEGIIPADALEQGLTSAVAGVMRYEEQLKDRRVLITDAMAFSTIVMLGRKGQPFNPAKPLRIAIQPAFRAVKDFLKKEFPHFQQVPVATPQESLDALRDGMVDGFMQNTYLLQPYLQGPRYASLSAVPAINLLESLAIAIPASADPLLLSVLNKSIKRLPSASTRQIFIDHTLAKPYVMTVEDIWLHYRKPIEIIAALTLLCLLLLGYGLHGRNKNIKLVRQNEETLKNITNNINGGVIKLSTTEHFPILYANNGFLSLLGYSVAEYEERKSRNYTSYMHPDDVQHFQDAVAHKTANGDTIVTDTRIRHKLGHYVPVLMRGTLGHDAQKHEWLYCVIVDISEQKAMFGALELEKERYRILLEQSSDMIFEYDAAARFVASTASFKDSFDISAHCGEAFRLPLHSEDEAQVDTMLDDIRSFRQPAPRRVRLRHKDDAYVWCRLSLSGVVYSGAIQRIVGRIDNIHTEVMAQQRLEAMAKRDSLTQLLNREAFRVSLEEHVHLGSHTKEGALYFLDIDNFKELNDQLGHQAGDKALQDVAEILRNLFRESDPAGRYGGDEFCVYAREISPTQIKEKALALTSKLQRTYYGENGTKVEISASIGVARCPSDAHSYEDLVDKADKALYLAKSRGKNQTAFYSPL